MNSTPKSKWNRLAKYSGLAFQLLSYILVGFFIGRWIDNYMKNQEPYAVLGCITLFLIAGLISVIRDVTSIK
jgi:F0F1-type ATP synthase assembly protein I